MNKEFVKEKIKIAKELVEEIDEPYKSSAFTAVLIKLLDDEKIIKQVSKQIEIKDLGKSKDVIDHIDIQKQKEEFANKCNITINELDQVLDIKPNHIQLLKNLKGEEVERQRLASKCLLTTFSAVLEREWVDSDTMIKCLEKSAIPLKNLPRNLRQDDESFSVRGRGQGNSLEYTITGPSKVSTYEIITKLAKGENPLE